MAIHKKSKPTQTHLPDFMNAKIQAQLQRKAQPEIQPESQVTRTLEDAKEAFNVLRAFIARIIGDSNYIKDLLNIESKGELTDPYSFSATIKEKSRRIETDIPKMEEAMAVLKQINSDVNLDFTERPKTNSMRNEFEELLKESTELFQLATDTKTFALDQRLKGIAKDLVVTHKEKGLKALQAIPPNDISRTDRLKIQRMVEINLDSMRLNKLEKESHQAPSRKKGS